MQNEMDNEHIKNVIRDSKQHNVLVTKVPKKFNLKIILYNLAKQYKMVLKFFI